MIEILVGIAALLGAALVFIAALGVVRLPDLYTRMHAASKASSLGLSLLLLAAAIAHPEPVLWLKAVLGILFLFLTAPVAAHLLGRSAYVHKVPLWKGSTVDELAGRYAPDGSRLESSAPDGEAKPPPVSPR
jgi:multicomponent Na+:H+ antiporter subunit G